MDSVVSDINCKSARRLLNKITENAIVNATEVSELIHGSMRPKLDEIMCSIEGITTPLQRMLISKIVDPKIARILIFRRSTNVLRHAGVKTGLLGVGTQGLDELNQRSHYRRKLSGSLNCL